MDLSRVLVVVLSMVASELSHVQTKPIDFVCDSGARKVMNKVKELKEQMVDCSAVNALPAPIQLPCISIHKVTWGKKTVHERQADILQSLEALEQDVRFAMNLTQPGCGRTLMERLERIVRNYGLVVKLLHVEQGEQDGRRPERCPVKTSTDLGLVLKKFEDLLSGKLEWLISEIAKEC